MLQPILPYPSFDAVGASPFREHLTPDALMTYLSTRLDGLDTQINAIFNRQQHSQAIQKALTNLRSALAQMKPEGTDPKTISAIQEALRDLTDLDSDLGKEVRNQLNQDGYVFADGDANCSAEQLKASMDYLNGIGKDTDSSAQLDMIRLQSIMSARQTAIQLATNLVSALGESTKSIVSNIGR